MTNALSVLNWVQTVCKGYLLEEDKLLLARKQLKTIFKRLFWPELYLFTLA